MTDSIKNILIVGGGTSGWITAAFLNRFLDPSKCSITLVESPSVGTIGVGEATVPPLVPLLRILGIEEDDFLRRCHATYKLGIKFVDWNRGGQFAGKDEIWHPFGPIGSPQVENLPVFHHWLRDKRAGYDDSHYTSYSLQALLGEMNRAPRTLDEGSIVTRNGAYAYHLDARAFADFLAELAKARGVVHITDDVVNVPLDARGFVRCVETAAHGWALISTSTAPVLPGSLLKKLSGMRTSTGRTISSATGPWSCRCRRRQRCRLTHRRQRCRLTHGRQRCRLTHRPPRSARDGRGRFH